ncbi:MAG: hypothetical protein ACOC56_04395, partial [Atribacterota bacterium]
MKQKYIKRDIVNVIRESKNKMFVDILDSFFLLEGKIVSFLIWDLVKFLESPRTYKEILEKFKTEEISEQIISEALKDLQKSAIIEKYTPRPDYISKSDEQRFKRELHYFNFLSNVVEDTNYEYLNRLRKSQVIIINLGELGFEILESLIDLKVGSIKVLDLKNNT